MQMLSKESDSNTWRWSMISTSGQGVVGRQLKRWRLDAVVLYWLLKPLGCPIVHCTVKNGIQEIHDPSPLSAGRQRRSGAGRKSLEYHNQNLVKVVEALVELSERGDPQSPPRWSACSFSGYEEERSAGKQGKCRTRVLSQRGAA